MAASKSKVDISALIAKLREKKKLEEAEKNAIIEDNLKPQDTYIETPAEAAETATASGMHGEVIKYNSKQRQLISLMSSGADCVGIGAAGTGKTTCTQGGIKALIESGSVPILQNDGHKHLPHGTPGVIIISYTRRAVNNIRKVQSEDMKQNCITAHKLLEYAPEYFEVYDEATGESKNSMRFIPTRHQHHPLPTSIHTIVVEESSMLGTELFEEICAALSHKVQWIFIGDIQQLPPVFGPAILGFKLNELPVVELTHVYRQALESPIIRLAHRILSGVEIPASEFSEWNESSAGQLHIKPWKKKILPHHALRTVDLFLRTAIETGTYDPEEDIILTPYNKSFGTLEMNKYIATYLARKRGEVTYEIQAGYAKHYFSIGDRVLFDREDAQVVDIAKNMQYSGTRVQAPSEYMDYWGTIQNPEKKEATKQAVDGIDLDGISADELMAAAAATEDRVTQASHILTVRLLDTGQEVSIGKSAEVNNMLHSYALTVHKAQGSEWRKVFLIFHQSQAQMMSRELLYTAVTRAREDLFIICEPNSFEKGIRSQRIKGNTLAEKAEYFKGRARTTKANGNNGD